MSDSNGTIGLGVTLGYSAVPATTYTLLGEIIDAQLPEIVMGKVDFTHSGSTRVENKPTKLPEFSDVSYTVTFLKAEYDTLEGFATAGTVKSWQVTIPDGGDQGGASSFEGFISKLGVPVPIQDRVTCQISITVTNYTGFTPAA